MRAPGEPIVHNRLLIREEVPAPPRPPPPVEISPPPRPPPPPEVDEEEETRAFWERYPLPTASYQPILSAAHNLHQVRMCHVLFGCLKVYRFLSSLFLKSEFESTTLSSSKSSFRCKNSIGIFYSDVNIHTKSYN